MQYDEIANAYILMNEMAYIRSGHIGGLTDTTDTPSYDAAAARYPTKREHRGLTVNENHSDNRSTYISTNSDGKTMHISDFSTARSGKIPFDHQYQSMVDQNKSVPSGFSRDIILHHIKNGKYPLRSSDDQSQNGYTMWRKLVPQAMEQGLHVYHWDGSKLHLTTKENIEEHLNSYASGVDSHQKHMIISKDPLDVI